MFYNHEILTSREYGVATVWLMATLGARSALRKVNRKAILDVNVSKACETIATPSMPIALRLQGKLLYGLSRVFEQQCGYVLADIQNAQNNMKALMRAMNTMQLDENVGRTRPEQLLLQDDPTFVPHLTFALPYVDFERIQGKFHSQDWMSLSPMESRSNSTDASTVGIQLGMILGPESDDGSGLGDAMANLLPYDQTDQDVMGGAAGGIEDAEELAPADFMFDEEGNIMELDVRSTIEPAVRVETPAEERAGSGRAAISQEPVAAENDEWNAPVDIEDNEILAAPPHFPPNSLGVDNAALAQNEDMADVDTAAIAIPQKRRHRRVLPLDKETELHNADLASWNNNYAARMVNETATRLAHKALTQAHKNTEVWLVTAGLGGVGRKAKFGIHRLDEQAKKYHSPLSMFAGEQLWQMLENLNPDLHSPLGKRSREAKDEGYRDEPPSSKARTSAEQPETVRQEDMDVENAPFMADEEIEAPRGPQTPLAESSHITMPWNVGPRSTHGSSASRGHANTSSIHNAGSRRGSRIPSASPLAVQGLHGGVSPSIFDTAPGFPDDWEDALMSGAGNDSSAAMPNDSHIADAGSDPAGQPAPAPTEGIDSQTLNFLTYILDNVREAGSRVAQEQQEDSVEESPPEDWTSFERLFPSDQENARVVGVSAFMHVLTLATNRKLEVQQREPFGDILMRSFTASDAAVVV